MTGLGASTVSGSSTLNISFVDRGTMSLFTDKFSVADLWNTTADTWRVQAVIDRSVLEVFVDGGATRGHRLVLPRLAALTLGHLATADVPAGVQVRVAICSVQSAWAAYDNN